MQRYGSPINASLLTGESLISNSAEKVRGEGKG